MVFCATLKMDRMSFNWLVNCYDKCWSSGCKTEEAELESQMALLRCSSATSTTSSPLLPAPQLHANPKPLTPTANHSDNPKLFPTTPQLATPPSSSGQSPATTPSPATPPPTALTAASLATLNPPDRTHSPTSVYSKNSSEDRIGSMITENGRPMSTLTGLGGGLKLPDETSAGSKRNRQSMQLPLGGEGMGAIGEEGSSDAGGSGGRDEGGKEPDKCKEQN